MTILRARWVLPIDSPPVENGEVVVEEGRIAEVRRESRARGEAVDLGESAILPGLVNAHSHLEYTALRGFLEDVPFFPWIRALTQTKGRVSPADWHASARLGALECLSAGITTVGDNADAHASLPAVLESGLRAVIFQEVFGIDHREPVEPIVGDLASKVERLQEETTRAGAGERVHIGISPHAPYTVRPELLAALGEYARVNGLPISIHVAESPAESELILSGGGPFGEMLERRGILWRVPGVSPTRYLYDQGMLSQGTLAVHCVHQSSEDIALTAQSGAGVVHCPKSNAKLGAGIAPLNRWLAEPSLPVGLGTDSAVSNNTLDLFEEMRFAVFLSRAGREEVEGITARAVLEMATLGGARALGLSETTGALKRGLSADITAVRLDTPHAAPARDPYSALVYCCRASDVRLTMVGGRVLYRDGACATLDKEPILRDALAMRARLASEIEPGRPTN